MVCIGGVSTIDTADHRLRLPVLCMYETADVTSLRRILREGRDGYDNTAAPELFIFKHAPEFVPTLIDNCLVESRLLLDVPAGLINSASA